MADEQNVNQEITEQTTATSGGGQKLPASDPKSNAPAEPQDKQAEKTFTQKELDDIVKQRLERAAKGQPTKEELAAFRRWQDEQKTDEQRHADELKAAQDKQTAAELRAADLEAKLAAMSKGVSAEAADDVIALAQGRVSDDVPLDKAIDEVLKKYPQFTASGAAPKAKITTGVPSTGGADNMSGVEKRFYEKNPQLLKTGGN